MANRKKLINVHSSVYTEGAPKAPSASSIELGEIAINYNSTEPAMFIKDASGAIVKFNAVQRSEISNLASDISDIESNNKIKLNGTEKSLTGSTWEFYAPTASGETGTVLVSKGANASPEWKAQSALTAGTAATAAKTQGTLTINKSDGTALVVFDGSANSAVTLTNSVVGAAAASHDHTASDIKATATTSTWGLTKLGTGATEAAAGNHTHSEYVNPEVTNKDIALSWGTKATAATIGDVAITLTPMSLPTAGDIGAASSSHTHSAADITSTASTTGYGITKLGTGADEAAQGNHTHSQYENPTVINKDITLDWGSKSTAATIGDTAITVTAMSLPGPGDIGAAASSHTHTAADLPTATTAAYGVTKLGTAAGTAAEGNHTHSEYENPAVVDKAATLGWGGTITAATIGNTAITVTAMAKPSASDIGAASASHTHSAADITSTASTTGYGVTKLGTGAGEAAQGNHTHSEYVNPTVTNKSATWAWGSTVTAATIGDIAITIAAPAKPTPSDIGAASSSHTHAGSDVSAATTDAVGVVQVGSFLSITTGGTLSVATGTTSSTVARGDHSHALPTASTTALGIMQAGSFLSATDGVVSVATGTTSATVARGDHSHTPASIGAAAATHSHTAADLPTASTNAFGIVKIGTASGTVAAGNHTHSEYVNPTVTNNNITLSWGTKATAATIGDVDITITPMSRPSASDIGAASASHTHAGTDVSAATASARGTVQVGNFLNVTTGGTISVVTGTTSSSVAVGNHTHNYAASDSAGGAASSTKGTLTLKNNAGTTVATFNGSANSAVTLTYSMVGAAPSSHDHTAGDLPTASTSAFGIVKVGTASGTVAAGDHTHSEYVNPTVTNKSATWSWGNTVTAATIGGTAITIAAPSKPTPSDIGAASASHTHAGTDVSAATTSERGTVQVGNFLSVTTGGTISVVTGTTSSSVAVGNHTHSYAGSASAGGAANSTKGTLTIKDNGGTTIASFNGSADSAITLTYSTVGAAQASHTHTAADLPTATTAAYGVTKLGTGAGEAAQGNHTHSAYVNPTVTNKSATWAWGDTVTAATIGNTAITITAPTKPTASDIGAASSTHSHTAGDLPTAATNAYGIMKVGSFLSVSNGVVSVSTGTGSDTVAVGNHTHLYAGSTSAGGAANSTKGTLTIKNNGGTTIASFNGSADSAITLTYSTVGAAAASHSHAGTEVDAATASVRGTVKPGSFLTVDSAGTLTVSTGNTSSTVARGDHNHGTASTSAYGVMKVGSFLSATDGVVSVSTGTTSSTIARGDHTHTPASIGAAASVHTHTIGDLPTATTITASNTTVPTTNAVKSYVDGLVASPVNYKGAVTTGTLPSSPKVGDLYIVQTSSITLTSAQSATGVAQTAETGDYIIARTTSTWDVIQKNLNGAVTSSDALTSGNFVLGNGSQTIKTSSYSPSSFAAASHGHAGTDVSAATSSVRGTVKPGTFLSVGDGGVLTVSTGTSSTTISRGDHTHVAAALPTASTSAYGIVKIGTASGTVAAGDHNHSGVYAAASHGHAGSDVSAATTSARGTVQVGNFLSATTDGSLSVVTGTSSTSVARGDHNHGTASTSAYGVMKVGSFLSATNGVVTVSTGTTSSTIARGDHSHSYSDVGAAPASHTHVGGDITSAVANATQAANSDKVDGYHVSVVTSMPSSPDANTIYILK